MIKRCTTTQKTFIKHPANSSVIRSNRLSKLRFVSIYIRSGSSPTFFKSDNGFLFYSERHFGRGLCVYVFLFFVFFVTGSRIFECLVLFFERYRHFKHSHQENGQRPNRPCIRLGQTLGAEQTLKGGDRNPAEFLCFRLRNAWGQLSRINSYRHTK